MGRESKKSGGQIRWRLWLGLAAAGVVCVCAAVAGLKLREFVATDARFVLSRDSRDGLAIDGLCYAAQAKVRHVFDADFGRGILAVPLAERRRRLLGIDWVEDASVSRVWPNRLMVRIRERRQHRFAHRSLIRDRSLRPARRFHHRATDQAQPFLDRAHHHARPRAAYIESYCVNRFLRHDSYSFAVMRSSSRRSNVLACGNRCEISGKWPRKF